MTQRGVLGVLDNGRGFRGGVDVRHLNAARSAVERTRDRRRLMVLHAHH